MSECLQKVELNGHTVQLFLNDDGTTTGYSFSQDKYYRDPLSQLPNNFTAAKPSKSPEEIQEQLEEIETYPILPWPERKLKQTTMGKFGVRMGLSEVDGETPVTVYFPYTNSYKVKLLEPKKFWNIGKTEDVFFGWQQAIDSGSGKLFITEGEVDALSLYQILKDKSASTKWAHLEPAVISIRNGAGSAKHTLTKHIAEINKYFNEVVLVFDMDEAGQKAIKEVVTTLPDIKAATLPLKDVSDCLVNGRPNAAANAVLFKADIPKNTRIVRGSSLREQARKRPEWGLSYPWDGLTDITRGRRRGETVYWGAGQRLAINYVNSGELLLGQS